MPTVETSFLSLQPKHPKRPKPKKFRATPSHPCRTKNALSTPPPPPEPPSTTTATTTATIPRPLFAPNSRPPPSHPHPSTTHPYQAPFYTNHPHHHPHPPTSRLPSNPNTNYTHLVPLPHPHDVGTTPTSTAATAIPYPVVSSGQGFLQKQTPPVTLGNHNPNSPLYHAQAGLSYPRPPLGYSHPDPGLGKGMGYVAGRPAHVQHSGVVGNAAAGVMPGVIKGVPVSGASSQSLHKLTVSPNPNSDCNGHKDLRERSKDDSAFATIGDRKVRMSDNASLYALCRSWLRNGFPEESQLQYTHVVRSLPRPLPLSAQDITSPEKKDDDIEEEEDEGSVGHLTPQELLQRHVKHAKRVRSQLRAERLQRIARYKTRLALLLPPMVDPHLRNDSASGK